MVTGLGYNTAALIGPDGYIGKYRKHGLNAQDQRWVANGDLGFPVFDTELGRITMLICYDDTYWQYGRLAALHDVDIIAWVSASDRVMPGTPADQQRVIILPSLLYNICRRTAVHSSSRRPATVSKKIRLPISGSTTMAAQASGTRTAGSWRRPP